MIEILILIAFFIVGCAGIYLDHKIKCKLERQEERVLRAAREYRDTVITAGSS